VDMMVAAWRIQLRLWRRLVSHLMVKLGKWYLIEIFNRVAIVAFGAKLTMWLLLLMFLLLMLMMLLLMMLLLMMLLLLMLLLMLRDLSLLLLKAALKHKINVWQLA